MSLDELHLKREYQEYVRKIIAVSRKVPAESLSGENWITLDELALVVNRLVGDMLDFIDEED